VIRFPPTCVFHDWQDATHSVPQRESGRSAPAYQRGSIAESAT